LEKLRTLLEKSVVKRLMTDVPYGVLLSGGLDSSLVASIASRHAAMRVEDDEKNQAWWPRLHSFAIGLENSPDLKYARIVADFLGTVHHEFRFTVEEGLDAIDNVIYHLETYDVTSIRASTPMYFMSRKIKAMGVKMVLSGEGSDEIFGGYLYFHKAPSPDAFHVETCKKLKLLSKYDCLRANKATSAWGVEVRCPFLDKAFLAYAMSINPAEKMIRDGKMEKYILRKAFDDPEKPWLPKEILWRQKEQFSDGVGYNWIDSLRKYAENEVTDEMMSMAAFRFPFNTPTTKEAYYYRSIFHRHFPSESAAKTVAGGPSIACSTPAAVEWDLAWKNRADPSGRAVSGVHQAAVEKI
jgi:asparagine synthase (glutamine-hydrolysing)